MYEQSSFKRKTFDGTTVRNLELPTKTTIEMMELERSDRND
jgi:hypothetical protein